jgi:hypothetical protein
VVAVTVLTGGAGLLAYLAAWVLIPREDAPPGAPQIPAGAIPPVDVRTAWSAVGRNLKSLAGDLRRSSSGPGASAPPPAPGAADPGTTSPGSTSPGTAAPAETAETPAGAVPTGTGMPQAQEATDGSPADPAAGPPPGAVPAQRSPLEAADDAATALGERLRAPEVQEGARRAAASVSQALAASVDEVGRRVRRDRG